MQHFYSIQSTVQNAWRASSNTNSRKLLILFFFTALFTGLSITVHAQSLRNVSISPTTFCTGSPVTVTFQAVNQNGNGNTAQHYTTSSTYQVYISSPGGIGPYTLLGDLPTTPSNFSPGSGDAGGRVNTVSTTIVIPNSFVLDGSSIYNVYLSSSAPTYTGSVNGTSISNTFTLTKPTKPTNPINRSYVYGATNPNKTLSVTVPLGQSVNWYTASTGGILVQPNSTTYTPSNTTVGTYTYYAEANISPCTSARTAVTLTITPKALTITTPIAQSKVYDRTNAAIISGTLNGVVGTDNVTFIGTGTFASINVGSTISVTSTSTLSGTAASNYTLTQPTGLSANITAKPVTINSPVAQNKVYDRTTVASITGTLVGVVAGDIVTWAGAGVFASSNVGNGISVASNSPLAGTNSGNYSFTQPTGLSANITRRPLTVSGITANSKVYDGNAVCVLTGAVLQNAVSGDDVQLSAAGVSAAFNNKNAGANKPVTRSGTYALTGGATGNYTLTQPGTAFTANITKKQLVLNNITADNKVYDRTTATELTGTFSGNIPGDDVGFDAMATFATANAGNMIAVTSNLALIGLDAGNYFFTHPTGLTANITQRPLTVTGITATSKEYDGLTACALSGATLQNTVSGDDVNLVVTGVTGAFNNKNANLAKSVSLSGVYGLTGAAANNYSLTQPTPTLFADITPKTLSLENVTATSRIYDGTLACPLVTDNVSLFGIVGSEDVRLVANNVAGSFVDKHVADDKEVAINGYSISGNDMGNYIFRTPTLLATITKRPVTVLVLSENKTDTKGNPIVNLLTGDLIANDLVALAYANAQYVINTQNNSRTIDVTGINLSGIDADNYDLKTLQATGLDPLPVTLVSFTGKYSKTAGVTLNWSTATEKDNDYFQMERSMDGKNFTSVGKVKGNGNSSMLIKYQFVDGQALNGTVYYRLKQVDFDGKFEFSKVIAVNAQAGALAVGSVKAYPNPTFTGKVTLEVGRGQGGTAKVSVMNGAGQVLSSEEVMLVEGQQYEVDLTQQKAGMYFLQVENGAGRSTNRIVKQ